MADAFWAAKPDVAVIVGNDQMELFDDKLMPAVSVFCGPTLVSEEYTNERMASLPIGVGISIPGYIPSGGAEYPGQPELATSIVTEAMAEGFDVTTMKSPPKRETPHAFSFVYRRSCEIGPFPRRPCLSIHSIRRTSRRSRAAWRWGGRSSRASRNGEATPGSP